MAGGDSARAKTHRGAGCVLKIMERHVSECNPLLAAEVLAAR